MELSTNNTVQSIFDLINKSFHFESKEFRTIILNEEIWFCGKDIAEILGYKDTDQALRKNIDKDDKMTLNDLILKFQEPVLKTGAENLNKNELSMIYINESGLYSLILRSKLKSAAIFKKYVTKEVLPAIRKVGLEKYIHALNDCKEQLAIAEKKSLNLTAQIKNCNIHIPDGFVYIATNEQYSQNNHYRIGRTTNLKKRLDQYNNGRTKQDKFYYVFIFETAMNEMLELTIRTLLKEYRETKRRDMYIINWSLLHPFVEYICNDWSDTVIEKNNLILNNLEQNFVQEFPEKLTLEEENIKKEYIKKEETKVEYTEDENEAETEADKLHEDIFLEWFEKNYEEDEEDEEDCYITLKEVFDKFRRSDEYYNCLSKDRKIFYKRDCIKQYILSTGAEFHMRIPQKDGIRLCSIFTGYSSI